jgi:alpha-beta hydrolase superfamily lysophospholipase
MKADELELRADDGVVVHVYRWLPDGAPRGVVQIVHGLSEHGARYARFGEHLTRAGWAVYASDHRGHGRTALTEEALGHFADEDGWSRVIADLRMIARHARGDHAGLPFVLFGHSMGSFLSKSLVLRHPQEIDALILSGSNMGGGALVQAGKQVAKLERLRKGRRGRSTLLVALSFGTYNLPFERRTAHDWISRDHEEVDRYAADPHCGAHPTTQLWIDLFGALDELGRGEWSRLPRELPIYVFAGDQDPVGDKGKGIRKLVTTLRSSGLSNVTERMYPGGRHEMLNEINRDEVTADVLRWLDENVGSRPFPQ